MQNNDNMNPQEEDVIDIKPQANKTLLLSFIALVAGLLIILNNLFILKPNEYAIVRQFGEIVKVLDHEGLKMKIPFVQKKVILPKSILLYDVPPSEINTLDKKRIVVDYYALWQITDPIAMIESLRTLEGAELRLSNIIYSNVRNELGKLEYGSIINPTDNNRGGVDQIVQDQINEILETNHNGIKVTDMKMKRIDLPLSNEESVYKRMISERESKAQEYLSQGDAEARKIKAEVDREVEEITAKARAEAELIVAKGEGEAAKIYNDIYGQDSDFFALYTTLESYKQTIDGETVVLLPIESPYLKYLVGNQ